MNQESHSQSVQAEVLTTITSGGATMRPKWYFIGKTVVLYASTIAMSLLAVLVISFTLFAIRRSGLWVAPTFGIRGWIALLQELPWLLVLAAILLVVLTQLIIRRFSFSYSHPAIFSAALVAVLAVGGGSLAAQSTLHMYLARQALDPHSAMPFAGPLYQRYERPPFRVITTGIITELNNDGFRMENRAGEDLVILITPHTDLAPQMLTISDTVVVLGQSRGDTIEALGIRKVIDDDPVVPQYPHRQMRMK